MFLHVVTKYFFANFPDRNNQTYQSLHQQYVGKQDLEKIYLRLEI